MKTKIILGLVVISVMVVVTLLLYPRLLSSKADRQILYWTDRMIPGDRSDHPGRSPMGMERTPVYSDEVDSAVSSHTSLHEDAYYTCPMHPSVIKQTAGACPICGMTLVKKTKHPAGTSPVQEAVRSVAISPSQEVMAHVSTTRAKRLALRREIRAAGRIDYAESNFRYISTRFPGRLDRLYLTYTGQRVEKGDPVADIYSPEAFSAQQEYLLAKEGYDNVRESADIISNGAKELFEQSRGKLIQWGFTDAQIANLDAKKEAQSTITIYSQITGTVLKKNVDPQHYAGAGEDMYDVADLSMVWMYVDIYEYEVQSIRLGQKVEAAGQGYPGKIFTGKVTFISPTIDPSSRTVRVRTEFPNPRGELRIGTYVDARVTVVLPLAVVVPVTALLSTGNRHVVWLQKQAGVYEARNVTPGGRAGEDIQILDGIAEGEIVVTSGGYLLDSESQLRAVSPSER